MARIFLCHASEDKPQVGEVYARLKAAGFEPWLDEEEILPGQDWNYEIEQALETCDFVMVFLSTRSVGKIGYVQREFRNALYRSEEMPEEHIHTIPVKLDDCEVPRRFRRHQWANLEEAGAFERIVRALHYGLAPRGLPVPEAPAPAETEVLPEWTNSIGMGLVRIPAGTFLTGSPDTDPDARVYEKPAHLVEITQPSYLGKYPVTQAQWEAVMGENSSRFAGHPNHPVESVSWEHVAAFIAKLNEREGKRPIVCPLKRSGKMPAARGRGASAIMKMSGRSPGSARTATSKRMTWVRSCPTPGDCMTCWVRCGSGLGIGMTPTRETLRGIRVAPSRAPSGSFAAVAGTAAPSSAVRRVDTASSPATTSATWAFAWRGRYSLALLPFYPWRWALRPTGGPDSTGTCLTR